MDSFFPGVDFTAMPGPAQLFAVLLGTVFSVRLLRYGLSFFGLT